MTSHNDNEQKTMTNQERDAVLTELFLPAHKIATQAINDIFEYFNNNKEEIKKKISEIAQSDNDPHARIVESDLDISMLAVAIVAHKECMMKFHLASLAFVAMGRANKGWDEFYEIWTNTKTKLADNGTSFLS